jgi:HD-GYP domain-containing protein (c-di-GMP phosphodiesterase class II)
MTGNLGERAVLTRIGVRPRGKNSARSLTDALRNEGAEAVWATEPVLADDVSAVVTAPEDLADAMTLAARHSAALEMLADALDARHGGSDMTSRRVMELSLRIGQALGMEGNLLVTLARGALLRDLGKVRVPNAVLLKDGLLTYDEWILIQNHTVLGAELANATPGFADIAAIARSHHECFDGTGYPDKLEAQSIPLAARIVRLADVYIAMQCPRPYRTSVATTDEAIEHIREEREKHFDPEVVDTFLEMGSN